MSIAARRAGGAFPVSSALTCLALLIAGCAPDIAGDPGGATSESAADRASPEPTDAEVPEAAPQPATSAPPSSNVPLESTRWIATELEGTAVPEVGDAQRAAHIVFDGTGGFAGSDGCNRVAGSYEINDDAITFGPTTSTQMACADTGETERHFRAALNDTRAYRIVDDRLELAGIAGTLVARFEADAGAGPNTRPADAGPGAPRADAASGLGGKWQLVRFEGGDGATLTPDDPASYTLEFADGGALLARLDCNRGRGTWQSTGAGNLTFGPLALTRAMCPPGSLHDQIVRQLPYVRSYLLKDGRLFLSLMADGGIYEFEPLPQPEP
jgi:heat shock protein HslJ